MTPVAFFWFLQTLTFTPGFSISPSYIVGALAFAMGYGVLHAKANSMLSELKEFKADTKERLDGLDGDVRELTKKLAGIAGELRGASRRKREGEADDIDP